jgi:hypothetical protein
MEIIDPTQYPNWDKLLLSTPGSTFFHTSAWAKVLRDSYNYKPLYFAILDTGGIRALIPVMEVNSFLTGKRGVSLPFSDYCEPIISGEISFRDMLSHVIEHGRKFGWKYLELRGSNAFLEKEISSKNYFGHTLSLEEDPEKLFLRVSHATRKNIRKAERENVDVRFYDSLDSMREFYRLHLITRKHHGVPPQPYSFFENIYHSLILKGFGLVSLATYRDIYVAGAVFLHFGKKAIIKYSGSKREWQHVRANNLIWWQAIKWYHEKGYKYLSFGRTDSESESLRTFKTGWAPNEEMISYYRYNFKADGFVKNSMEISAHYTSVSKRMPQAVFKLIGRLLYRHMG